MTVKIQRSHKRELKAGIPQTIEQGAEFVFIDQGRDLTVRAGSSIMPGRRSGDVMRFSEVVKSITLISPYDQVVEIVVGFGEYNRLIVSGELNVSAYVTSRGRGESPELPLSLSKTVGLVNSDYQKVVKGATKVDTADVVGETVGGVFYYDGEFYGLSSSSLYKIDTTASAYKSVDALDVSGVTMDGTGYVRAAGVTEGGTVYFIHNNDLYRFSLNDLVVELVKDNGWLVNRGGFVLDDKFYFSYQDNTVDRVAVWDIASETWVSWTHANLKNAIFYDPIRKAIVSHAFGGNSGDIFSLDGEYKGSGVDVAVASQGGTVVDEKGELCVTAGNNRFNVRWFTSAEYFGEIYVEQTGDATTRKSLLLDEKMEFAPRLGKTLMTGRVVRQLLRAIKQGEPENYLDYVVSLEYSDGYNVRKISSGTYTWEFRGIQDKASILLDSPFTLEVLPAVFYQ